jgi:DUF1365 family protein
MTTPMRRKPALEANSGLYECSVVHCRFAPKKHRFAYRIFMMAVDLDELETLATGIPFLSVNGRNLFSFMEADYMPTGEPLHNGRTSAAPAASASLKARVLSYLSERGVEIPGGRIMLLTLPRVAGYLFNPVSFYFCYDSGGRPTAAIAEVTNTFREVKPFLLGPGSLSGPAGARMFQLRIPKLFYVSPFSDVDVSFDFLLRTPGDELSIRIDDFKGDERTLASALTGRRKAFTGARLAWFGFKYPLITLKVIVSIHVQALLLRIKRVPWFPKAARAVDQRDLYRPHESIESTPLP